jgi:hypothetical protein
MELSLQVHAVGLDRDNDIPSGAASNAAATATLKLNKTKNCISKNFLQSDRNGSTNVGCATFAHWRIFYGHFRSV